MVFLSVGLFLISSFVMLWAFNLSFAAHLQGNSKSLFLYHFLAYLAIAVSLAMLIIGILIL